MFSLQFNPSDEIERAEAGTGSLDKEARCEPGKRTTSQNCFQVTPSRLGRTRSQGTTNAGQAISDLKRKILVRHSSTRNMGNIQPAVEIHIRVLASRTLGDLERFVQQLVEPTCQFTELGQF